MERKEIAIHAFLVVIIFVAFWLTTVVERCYFPPPNLRRDKLNASSSCQFVDPRAEYDTLPSNVFSHPGDTNASSRISVESNNPLLSRSCSIDVDQLFTSITDPELTVVRVYVVLEVVDDAVTWRLAPGRCPNTSLDMQMLFGSNLLSALDPAVPRDMQVNLTFLFERQGLTGSARAFAKAYVTLSPFFELVLPSAFSPFVGWSSITNTARIKLSGSVLLDQWKRSSPETKTRYLKEALKSSLQKKLTERNTSGAVSSPDMLRGLWHTRFAPRESAIHNLGFELASHIYHHEGTHQANIWYRETQKRMSLFDWPELHIPILDALVSAALQFVFGLVSLHLLIWAFSLAISRCQSFEEERSYTEMAQFLESGKRPRELYFRYSCPLLRTCFLLLSFVPAIFILLTFCFGAIINSYHRQVFDLDYSGCGSPVLMSFLFVSMTIVVPFMFFLLVLFLSQISILRPIQRLANKFKVIVSVFAVATGVPALFLRLLCTDSEIQQLVRSLYSGLLSVLRPVVPADWLLYWNPLVLFSVLVVAVVFTGVIVAIRDTITQHFGTDFVKLTWWMQYERICRTAWGTVQSDYTTAFGPISVLAILEYCRYYITVDATSHDTCSQDIQQELYNTDLPFWLHPHTAHSIERSRWPLVLLLISLVADRLLWTAIHFLGTRRGYCLSFVVALATYISDVHRHWIVAEVIRRLEAWSYRLFSILLHLMFVSSLSKAWGHRSRVIHPMSLSCLAGLLFVCFQLIQMNFEFILRRAVLTCLALILHIPMTVFISSLLLVCALRLFTGSFVPIWNVRRIATPEIDEFSLIVSQAANRVTTEYNTSDRDFPVQDSPVQ